MLFESLPQVVGVGLGDSAALAVLLGRDGWQFFVASGQDIAIALLEVLVFAAVSFLLLRLETRAQVCCSRRFMLARPGVALGLDDEGQLAQQVRTT